MIENPAMMKVEVDAWVRDNIKTERDNIDTQVEQRRIEMIGSMEPVENESVNDIFDAPAYFVKRVWDAVMPIGTLRPTKTELRAIGITTSAASIIDTRDVPEAKEGTILWQPQHNAYRRGSKRLKREKSINAESTKQRVSQLTWIKEVADAVYNNAMVNMDSNLLVGSNNKECRVMVQWNGKLSGMNSKYDELYSRYIIVDACMSNMDPGGNQWVRMFGEKHKTTVVRLKRGININVLDLAELTQRTPRTLQRMACNLLGVGECFCRETGKIWSYAKWFGQINKYEMQEVVKSSKGAIDVALRSNKMLSGELWERGKVTKEYQLHIKIHQILTIVNKISDQIRKRAIQILVWRLLKYNETQAFVVAVLVWALSVPRAVVWYFAKSNKLWHGKHNTLDWFKRAQSVAGAAKMHHGMDGKNLKWIFELQVLVNRNTTELDWEEQKKIRDHGEVVELPPGYVREQSRRIFEAKQPGSFKYKTMTADEMWRSRLMTIPTGAVHSQFNDYDFVKEWDRGYRTKKYALSAKKSFNFDTMVRRRPEIVAWPSEKFEHGKARPIYGTDINSYLIHELAAKDIEHAFPAEFAMGKDGLDEQVDSKIRQMNAGGIPFCFDFSDFNTQHSLQSQKEAMQGYFDVHRANMTPDQVKAAEWTVESLMNQKIKFPDETLQVKFGLFSGLRYTTVINSVLNKIYMEWAGLDVKNIPTLHLGDDVISYMQDMWQALDVMNGAVIAGIRANPAK